MVNKPLEARRGAREAKRSDELLEKAISGPKGGLLLVTLTDPEAVECGADIYLYILIRFADRAEGLLD